MDRTKKRRRTFISRKMLKAKEHKQIPCYSEYHEGDWQHVDCEKFKVNYIKTAKGNRVRRGFYCEDCRKKALFARPKTKEHIKRHRERYNKKYPEKHQAHKELNKALKSGKIHKKPCLICRYHKTQGHHFSYEKKYQLAVVWLCQTCHSLYHRGSLPSDDIRYIQFMEWKLREIVNGRK